MNTKNANIKHLHSFNPVGLGFQSGNFSEIINNKKGESENSAKE